VSVTKVERKRGPAWQVRYRDGRRNRSATFDRKADAVAFEAEVRRRKRLGTLAQLDAGDELLSDFGREWWRLHARPNLAPSTQRRYVGLWDLHVLPYVGRHRLREITPEVVANLRADLDAAGVGAASARKALFVLQSVMRLAVLQGKLQANPVKVVTKPRQERRTVRPLPPETVERLRANLPLREATLVSVLAYAGLRPGEALALAWGSIRERTILVERSVVLGQEKGTKTNATRTVRLLRPLAQDLAAWRLASGRPPANAYVFQRADGRPWRDDDYRNWRKRHFNPAAKAAGVPDARPYDLRHSFVSLLIQEGVSIVDVARQAGHSPEECLRTYAHVFEEFDPTDRTPAEERIGAARREPDVRDLYVVSETATCEEPRFGSGKRSRRWDSNPRPPLYESGALAN
jgi:integrase